VNLKNGRKGRIGRNRKDREVVRRENSVEMAEIRGVNKGIG
jgi:hypothetical protein